MKHYMGFAICLQEKEVGVFFKRKKIVENFCRITIGADSFTEVQERLCDKMQLYKMSVAIIFPYAEEDIE